MLIGRIREMARLREALNSDVSEFIAVYGRRRVGKTFLIREAFESKFTFFHAGLARGDKAAQLDEFSKSLALYGLAERPKLKSWSDAFFELEMALSARPRGKKVIFLDELPWMDTQKSGFIDALEHFWNGWCAMRKDIVLVVCGSATSWIVSKIMKNHGGLHNRLTDQIRLQPFTLKECEEMSVQKHLNWSRQQILEAYMVLGGVPFYWEKLEKSQSVDQNIDRLFFGPEAPFGDEFEQLYASLFKHPAGHIAVVTALGVKKCGMTRMELMENAGLDDGGAVSKVLKELESCGFIRSYSVPGKKKRSAVYQLIDNFTLFYFKFMTGNRNRRAGEWLSGAMSQSRRIWNGLAFERVVLAHVNQMKKALGISGVRTVEYAWRAAKQEATDDGAQIDLLIHRADKAVNICEMKYGDDLFEISAEEMRKLKRRREVFVREEKFRGSVFLTMVTPHGVVHNVQWNDIQSEVTLDDLFANG